MEEEAEVLQAEAHLKVEVQIHPEEVHQEEDHPRGEVQVLLEAAARAHMEEEVKVLPEEAQPKVGVKVHRVHPEEEVQAHLEVHPTVEVRVHQEEEVKMEDHLSRELEEILDLEAVEAEVLVLEEGIVGVEDHKKEVEVAVVIKNKVQEEMDHKEVEEMLVEALGLDKKVFSQLTGKKSGWQRVGRAFQIFSPNS